MENPASQQYQSPSEAKEKKKKACGRGFHSTGALQLLFKFYLFILS